MEYLLGLVSKIERPEFEGYYDIDIELFSNLTQKEFVYIIKNKNLNQIEKLNPTMNSNNLLSIFQFILFYFCKFFYSIT